jgi:hypothetical protein
MPTLSTPQRNALALRNVMRRVFVYVEALDPDTGDPAPAGFWDDLGNVDVDGLTYYGVGALGDAATASNIAATSDMSVSPLVLTLSGLPPEVAALVRGSTVGQRPISLSFGIFDVDSRAVIGSLVKMFDGFVDDIEIKTPKSGGASMITLTCESIGREMTIRSTDVRAHESQQARQSGDDFFKYTEGTPEQTIYFGRKGPGRKNHGKIPRTKSK